jgi:hypothetical protein
MNSANAESPRRGVLWFAAPAMMLFTAFMYLFFDQRGGWPISEIVFVGVCAAMSFGLVMALINATKFWWGLRIVTFIIFAAYLAYLLHEFWFTSQPLEVTPRRSAATPFNAILGFLFFGVPCLLYSFWGSTWGKLGHAKPENVTRWDIANFYLAWGAQWLFLILSVVAVVVGLWRS